VKKNKSIKAVLRSATWTGALLMMTTVTSFSASGADGAPRLHLTLPHNIAPSPDYQVWSSSTDANGSTVPTNPCVANTMVPAYTNSAACSNFVLRAINAARASEGVKPMILPSNWYTLSAAQQLFVVADLERVDRGLPPYLGINQVLAVSAGVAARQATDPSIAPGFAFNSWGSTYAGGMSPLDADYMWMYNDGWGGGPFPATINSNCTNASASGCWGHREVLLGSDPALHYGVGLACTKCEMGTGYAKVHGYGSYTDLIALPAGAAPVMTFTWAKNVKPFLGGPDLTRPAAAQSLSGYLGSDPLIGGTAVASTVLNSYASQVQGALGALLTGTEQVTESFNAWTVSDKNGTEVALIGLASFTGPVPTTVAATVIQQACTSLGGVAPSTTTSVVGLPGSVEATCTDGSGGTVNVVTWAKANVQAAVVLDGAGVNATEAEATAVAQDAKLPSTGIVNTASIRWQVSGTSARLTKAQMRMISSEATAMTKLKIVSVKFTVAAKSNASAARSHARTLVTSVASYLSAQMSKAGISPSTLSALSLNHPVVTSFPRARSTSVVVTIGYAH
jgi:hypothetical protein